MGVKEEIFRVYQGCIKKPYGREGAEKNEQFNKINFKKPMESHQLGTVPEITSYKKKKKKQTFHE